MTRSMVHLILRQKMRRNVTWGWRTLSTFHLIPSVKIENWFVFQTACVLKNVFSTFFYPYVSPFPFAAFKSISSIRVGMCWIIFWEMLLLLKLYSYFLMCYLSSYAFLFILLSCLNSVSSKCLLYGPIILCFITLGCLAPGIFFMHLIL